MQEKIIQIDVAAIVRSKTSRRVPKRLLRRLAKIIHQDEINVFLRGEGRFWGYPFFGAVLKLVNFTGHIVNLENIERDRRFIFVANHPLGALEAMAIGEQFGSYFGEDKINFITNDLLSHLLPLADYFTPVNVVSSSQERDVVDRLDKLFASDKQIIIFPSGACSRRFGKTIADFEWKKMFVAKARQYGRDVVPVHITGRNSNFFYNLSAVRRALGVKFNLELLFLPDEMFKQRNNAIQITVGTPVAWQTFDRSYSDFQWAQKIRRMVYDMGENALSTQVLNRKKGC
ncbi:MAG: 1-acyl-sn-glycerol-3-phosphate acyltransferase [Prevotellaceae bacterium]|jgi:hypothetical protein|nr:1-acyl-sn-glycerol-3-phosphate acyltransferase [Prevotellaceae bacterium]